VAYQTAEENSLFLKNKKENPGKSSMAGPRKCQDLTAKSVTMH